MDTPQPDARGPLLSWQWRAYPDNHADRRNLLLHLATNPLFLAGNLAALAAPLTQSWALLAGLGLSALALAAQGRGHAREPVPPVPFRGPGDFVARVVAEQWITFPRFVLTGGWRAAWRAASRPAAPPESWDAPAP